MSVQPRNLSPFMTWVRNFLLGRELKTALRFQDFVATRSPPPPKLPDGVHHKLSGNYYFTRDARRATGPPQVLIDDATKLFISAGGKESPEGKTAPTKKKIGAITPGIPYDWNEAPKQELK